MTQMPARPDHIKRASGVLRIRNFAAFRLVPGRTPFASVPVGPAAWATSRFAPPGGLA